MKRVLIDLFINCFVFGKKKGRNEEARDARTSPGSRNLVDRNGSSSFSSSIITAYRLQRILIGRNQQKTLESLWYSVFFEK